MQSQWHHYSDTSTIDIKQSAITGTVYTITVNNVTDCKSNMVANENSAKVGLPAEPSLSDVVINEILFNPRSNGFDYVEFYNRKQ